MSLSAAVKSEIIKKFGKNEKDTGSSAVQVALLTEDINKLQEHFKAHTKDHHSRRGLIAKVNTRKSLLDYLKKTDVEQYRTVIAALGLRK